MKKTRRKNRKDDEPRLFTSELRKHDGPIQETVAARQVRIVDKEGRIRIEMGCFVGPPVIALHGATSESPSVIIGSEKITIMCGLHAERRIDLGILSNGDLLVFSKHGDELYPAFALGMDAEGLPFIYENDSGEKLPMPFKIRGMPGMKCTPLMPGAKIPNVSLSEIKKIVKRIKKRKR